MVRIAERGLKPHCASRPVDESNTGKTMSTAYRAGEHLNVRGRRPMRMHATPQCMQGAGPAQVHAAIGRMQPDCMRARGHCIRAARSARNHGTPDAGARLCTQVCRTACIHAGVYANIRECTRAPARRMHARWERLHASTIARKSFGLHACTGGGTHTDEAAPCGPGCTHADWAVRMHDEVHAKWGEVPA
jgi:hypothetical protein